MDGRNTKRTDTKMDKKLRRRLLGRLLRDLEEPFHIDGLYETNWTEPWLKVDAGHSIEVMNYLEWVAEGRLVRVCLWRDEPAGSGRVIAEVTGVPGDPEAINAAVAWAKGMVGKADEHGSVAVPYREAAWAGRRPQDG